MRASTPSKGFTLIELAVALGIAAIMGAIIIRQGLAARQSADIAGGAFELALRMQSMKARAVADARDYVLVVIDAANPAACVRQREQCGQVLVLRNPAAAFTINGFDPTPPLAGIEYVEDERLPLNTRFALDAPWTPPQPFDSVTSFDPAIRANCVAGRACFAIRFRANGEVTALFPGPAVTRAGFAFVLRPQESQSAATQRRGLFVSFPAGLVKSASF